jgi:hypothetical protein
VDVFVGVEVGEGHVVGGWGGAAGGEAEVHLGFERCGYV